MAATPPRITVFEKRTLSHRVRAAVTVAFVTAIYSWKFAYLQQAPKSRESSLTREDRRTFRLRRRFVAGATAGYIASKYSLAEAASRRLDFIYADLCAAWSNFLIAADAATDTKGLSRADSSHLLRLCFDAMFEPVEALASDQVRSIVTARYLAVFQLPYVRQSQPSRFPGGPDFRLERYAVRMASDIGDDIAKLCRCPFAERFQDAFQGAVELFFTRTLDLMAGQLATLDQSRVDDEHHWGWYKDVLQNKFTNVLLSPISLFVNPGARRNPEETMRECFRLISLNFFHRQVLDDLLDFDEDLESFTANSLIYILVSQGRVSAVAAQGNPCEESAAALRRELDRSGLLIPEFQIEPGSETFEQAEWAQSGKAPCKPDSVTALVRRALINKPGDKAMPLEELLQQCQRRKKALLDAWAARDLRAVTEIVEGSGVAARILDGITARADRREIEQRLERLLDDPGIREIMYVYYSRTLRTYEKCVRKWRSRGADPRTQTTG
jgi:hypothetical protein